MTRQEVRDEIDEIKEFQGNFMHFFNSVYKGEADDVIREIAVEVSNLIYEKEAIYTAALIEAQDDNIVILA